jgi:predicted Zn-ribbon and HTH transcriptional regulator
MVIRVMTVPLTQQYLYPILPHPNIVFFPKHVEDRNPVQTIRQQMILLLSEKEMGARDLSQALGIREKEVYEHLSHIARSVATQRKEIKIRPSQCLLCEYVFKDRRRFTPPSRCPRCKKAHLQRPTYRIL